MPAYTDRVGWWEYVKEVAGDDSVREIARKMGGKVHPSTVDRWDEVVPDGRNAAAFGRAYGRPAQESLVAAGILTREEFEDALDALDEEDLLLLALAKIRKRKAAELAAEDQAAEAADEND